MKTKMKTPKTPKAENSKTLQFMKLYFIELCSRCEISTDDALVLYKHIEFAENHPEILAQTDADMEKKLKKLKKEKGE